MIFVDVSVALFSETHSCELACLRRDIDGQKKKKNCREKRLDGFDLLAVDALLARRLVAVVVLVLWLGRVVGNARMHMVDAGNHHIFSKEQNCFDLCSLFCYVREKKGRAESRSITNEANGSPISRLAI